MQNLVQPEWRNFMVSYLTFCKIKSFITRIFHRHKLSKLASTYYFFPRFLKGLSSDL